MSYNRKTPWLDIVIRDGINKIFIEQRWKITWKNDPGTTSWTLYEKMRFQMKVRKIIRSTWGKSFQIKASGNSAFVKKNDGKLFPVNFIIHDTSINPHWNVTAKKNQSWIYNYK